MSPSGKFANCLGVGLETVEATQRHTGARGVADNPAPRGLRGGNVRGARIAHGHDVAGANSSNEATNVVAHVVAIAEKPALRDDFHRRTVAVVGIYAGLTKPGVRQRMELARFAPCTWQGLGAPWMLPPTFTSHLGTAPNKPAGCPAGSARGLTCRRRRKCGRRRQ